MAETLLSGSHGENAGHAGGSVDAGALGSAASGTSGAGQNTGAGAATQDTGAASGDGGQGSGAAAAGNGEGSGTGKQDAGALPSYTDFTVPEGVALDAEVLGDFKVLAGGLKLNQEQAQQMTDLGVKLLQKWQAGQAEAQQAQAAAWLQAVRSDAAIGGEKLAENLAVAAKAMQAFASPELKALLDRTGLGNHPELIKAFVKAGQLISEDSLVPGGTRPPGNQGKSQAEILYPGLPGR